MIENIHICEEELLINHPRFKRIGYPKKNLLFSAPVQSRKYYDFFNNYAKNNYTYNLTDCICGANNDQMLSKSDRFGFEYHTVICKNCGLIRGKEYFTDEDVSDFYTNHYWKIDSPDDSDGHDAPEEAFVKTFNSSKDKANLIKKYIDSSSEKKTIIDIGGRIGGLLGHFQRDHEVVLADYFKPYLDYAEKKGMKVIEGGLSEVDLKPDVIILSHVVEHWNNFKREIDNLIKIQKKNKTLTYIEFPGIDSLKLGRRDADVLGDIYVPHMYYFTSYVFEDIMQRHGFEKVYLDSEIRGIFRYTGIIKKEIKNNFLAVKNDLVEAEKKRLRFNIFSKIRQILPKFILNIIRIIRKPKYNP